MARVFGWAAFLTHQLTHQLMVGKANICFQGNTAIVLLPIVFGLMAYLIQLSYYSKDVKTSTVSTILRTARNETKYQQYLVQPLKSFTHDHLIAVWKKRVYFL
jgi:hypothetical protein